MIDRCMLCGGASAGPAFPYATRWGGSRFTYVECAECRCTFVTPVPTPAQFEAMYRKTAYHDVHYEGLEIPADTHDAVTMLSRHVPAGSRLLDFGCGNGAFIQAAAAAGYVCHGIELDEEARISAARNSGCPVRSLEATVAAGDRYRVIHLGDVLEHLPDPAATLRALETLLDRDGVFFVEGPIEKQRSPVRWTAAGLKRLRRAFGNNQEGEIPPFHLTLTDWRCQRRFFEVIAGYVCVDHRIRETGWPYLHTVAGAAPSWGARIRKGIGVVAVAAANLLPALGLGNRFQAVLKPPAAMASRSAMPQETAAKAPRPRILFISYDGMMEPLGQSQVLSYLERLTADADIHLISFEKPEDLRDRARTAEIAKRIRVAGIRWTMLRYHRTPSALATAWDVARGMLVALVLVVRHRIAIVHARSYVPALIALPVKRLTGARLLFDMRGFWADERVDGGLWAGDGRLYRWAKQLERHALLASDHVVSLTEAAVREIRTFDYLAGQVPPISVIPTCADLDRFRPAEDRSRAGTPFLLGYTGSVGTWYLLDEVIAFFLAIRVRIPSTRLLIVNRGDHRFIRDRLSAAGVDDAAVELVAAEHRAMPELVQRMTAGACLSRKPSFSAVASAPTKLGEMLGCGVPCVVNDRVGDMAQIVERSHSGVVLRSFDAAAIDAAAEALIALAKEDGVRERCVDTARTHFALDRGVEAYAEIYRHLAEVGSFRD